MSSIVIYGARGWVGKSAISVLRNKFSNSSDLNIILIGSKNSEIEIDGIRYSILDSSLAKKSLKKVDFFLNAAFLRRELLKSLKIDEYIERNNKLSQFALDILEEFQPKTFINLSSGVAAKPSESLRNDPYGTLKLNWEKRFSDACEAYSINSINCRIYSLTGRFINEFENLALSQFIINALKYKKIYVNSEKTFRTYVDSETLCELLFNMAFKGASLSFDSGGVITTMRMLAEAVKSEIDPDGIEIITGNDQSEDYFGDYVGFQKLLNVYNIKLETLEEQIAKTLKAFP